MNVDENSGSRWRPQARGNVTLVRRWDVLSQGGTELVLDSIKRGRDVPRQSGTDDPGLVRVLFFEEVEGVVQLKGLCRMIATRGRVSVTSCTFSFVRSSLTSLNSSRVPKTSSGAFLMSSTSSTLVGSTIHPRKVGILNNPGLA